MEETAPSYKDNSWGLSDEGNEKVLGQFGLH